MSSHRPRLLKKFTTSLLLLAGMAWLFCQYWLTEYELQVRRNSLGPGPPASPAPVAPKVKGEEILKKDLKWNSRESLYYRNDRPFTGLAVDFHKNAQPRLRWGMKEGKLHGLIQEYNEQGVQVTSKYYADGLRHGETRYFYPEGQLMKVVQYKNDLEDGPELLYNRDGSALTKHP